MQGKNIYKDILLGVGVGDALGVPAGAFSADAALTFCLAEALTKPFQLQNVADNFVDCLNNKYWTPDGEMLDVDVQTSAAIENLANGINPELAGGAHETANGNGSLMRILPLVIYIKDKPVEERFRATQQVSSLTHRHLRAIIACFYFLEFARKIIHHGDKFRAYKELQSELKTCLQEINVNLDELFHFDRLLQTNIVHLLEADISSSDYVIHTLEASIWCLLTTDSYEDAVLKALNLSDDTTTTAVLTGGLAALLYGHEQIPKDWLKSLARAGDIEDLAVRLAEFND